MMLCNRYPYSHLYFLVVSINKLSGLGGWLTGWLTDNDTWTQATDTIVIGV